MFRRYLFRVRQSRRAHRLGQTRSGSKPSGNTRCSSLQGGSSMSFRPLAHEVFYIIFSYLIDSKLMDPPREKPLAIALDFSTRFAVPSRSSGLVVKAQSWKVDKAPDSHVAPLVQGQCVSVSPYACLRKRGLGDFPSSSSQWCLNQVGDG